MPDNIEDIIDLIDPNNPADIQTTKILGIKVNISRLA